MEIKQYQKIAEYVLENGTYSFGVSNTGVEPFYIFINSVKNEFGIFEKDIKEFVDYLEGLEIISHIFYVQADIIDLSFLPKQDSGGFVYDSEVSIPRIKNFIKYGVNKNYEESKLSFIKIRDIKLRASNFLLEINNGEKIISFKSKTKNEGLDKETKQFKILMLLWDFHWELKDGKVLKKGDFNSLENLKRGSMCPTIEATYQHIKRINNLFKENGLSIEIKGENEKYRLIINK